MRRLIPCLAILLTLFSCRHDPDMPFRQVLADYFTAIQEKDVPAMSRELTLYNELKSRYGDTGEALLTFRQTVESILEDYETEREAGMLAFDPYGIKASLIMGLGRGFYYRTVSLEQSGKEAVLVLSHTFSYDQMDYSVFPQGTRLFFLSCPPGKVVSYLTGEYQKGYRVHLKRIHTEWTFEQNMNGNWKLDHMRILPDTAECVQSHRATY